MVRRHCSAGACHAVRALAAVLCLAFSRGAAQPAVEAFPPSWAAAFEMNAAANCTWCGAGPCDMSLGVTKEHFATSITPQTDRAYPYWKPALQSQRLGDASDATTVIIVHHGSGRNGDEYTQYLAPYQSSTTLVFGCQIFERSDAGLDAETELYWAADTGAEGGYYDWKWGGESAPGVSKNATISSFQVIDEMVLAIEKSTPRLEELIIAGHSAGGQIVQRYALFSTLAHSKTRFYAANPSSVTYLSPLRPVLEPMTDCSFCVNETIKEQTFAFDTPSEDCGGAYDLYGYGLEGPSPPYVVASKSIGQANLTARYVKRRVSYVSGESDVCDAPYMNARDCFDCFADDHGLDTSCEAMLQGHCRMQRVHAFAQYVATYLGAAHPLVSVPGVGHNGCAIFQSDAFQAAAFDAPQQDPLEEEGDNAESHVASYTWWCDPPDAAFCSDDAPRGVAAPQAAETSATVARAAASPQKKPKVKRTLPGNVMMGGGTDVEAAFRWHVSRGGPECRFLVLRESGTDAYNSFVLDLGAAAVGTLVLNTRAAAEDPFVLAKVRQADAIFFAGGDQSKYVSRIRNTTLQTLLFDLSRDVTIGGTSAGNAILGKFVYTGATGSATSTEALADPYSRDVDLVDALLRSPALDAARVLMDDHFVTRDRMGRLVAFLARLVADDMCCADEDDKSVRGVGVDEKTALLLDGDTGVATVVGESTAYACQVDPAASAMRCEPGTPLTLAGVACLRMAPGDVFDFYAWNGTGDRYSFDVVHGQVHGDEYGPHDHGLF